MTNKEAIKVLSALWSYKDPHYSETEIREALDLAIKALEARTQGEWIPIYPLTDKCSLCNGEALDFNDYPYRSKFCPHCGAKMKGGEAVAEDNLHNPGP